MIVFLIAILAVAALMYGVVVSGSRKKNRRSHRHSSSGFNAPRLSRSDMATRWQVIVATSQTGASGLKSALNEADKLFDQALRQAGLSGDTMGARLKAARSRFSDYAVYDAVWRAHKLRNALAHEIAFDLVPSQAHEAIRDFEAGLKALGAL